MVQELHLVSVHVLCEYVDLDAARRPGTRRCRTPASGVDCDEPQAAGRRRRHAARPGRRGRACAGSPRTRPRRCSTRSTCRDRPGGAGLAALLAAGHGYDVALVTALADDAGGARLSELLTAAGVEVYALPLPGATPEKVRLRAGGQVLLRLDRGGDRGHPGEPADGRLGRAARPPRRSWSATTAAGWPGSRALRAALEQATAPVVWDPHPHGPAPVPGARLVTPNEAEVRTLAGDAGGGSTLTAAQRAGQLLRQRWRAGAVAVTCGADGAMLCHAGPTPLVVPAAVAAPTATPAAPATGSPPPPRWRWPPARWCPRRCRRRSPRRRAYVAAGGVAAALAPERPSAPRPSGPAPATPAG